MQHNNQWLVVIAIIVGLQLSACTQQAATPPKVEPATVEPGQGKEFSRVILTANASERLGIKTVPVREAQVARKPTATAPTGPASPDNLGSPTPAVMDAGGTTRKVVPYSAVLYDIHGKTWVYKNPEPLTFLRHQIEVDYIEGDQAVLADGPETGTQVVTVGVAELYGTEFGVGH